MLVNYRMATQLVASRVVLSSTELVRDWFRLREVTRPTGRNGPDPALQLSPLHVIHPPHIYCTDGVDLYVHFPLRLHGVVLSYLSTRTTSLFFNWT
jgi:hypothetical protein